MRIDSHQHLWSEELVEALSRRTSAPFLRRRGRGWQLELASEPPSPLAGAPELPGRRAELLDRDGVDGALVALSSALGAEGLAPDEAQTLTTAHLRGVADAGPAFGAWGSVPLLQPDPVDVDDILDAGAVGLCLPAGAVATPAALDLVGPLLERLEQRDAPLFVHPGPSPWHSEPAAPSAGGPAWWPGLTDYVASMNSAWMAWIHTGRRAHPQLRVLFAMLAGGGPLHLERLSTRGDAAAGLLAAFDPYTFYDTSSYGPRAIGAVADAVGARQIVHGSDRPVAAPRPATTQQLTDNPRRLLGARGEALWKTS